MDPQQQKEKQTAILEKYIKIYQETVHIAPKVAYYCRLYGLEQALALGEKNIHPKVKEFMEMEFASISKLREKLGISKDTERADGDDCLNYAKLVFTKSDKLDRSESSAHYKAAAMGLKRAHELFSMCSRFGTLPEDIEQLKKYAAYRSVQIAKAIAAGTVPEPPVPRELSATADAELMDALNSIPSVPSGTAMPPIPPSSSAIDAVNGHLMATVSVGSAPFAGSTTGYPGNTLPPRHFNIGQKVMYCPDGTMNGVREPAEVVSIAGGNAYIINVVRRRQQCTVAGEFLAPILHRGETLVYYPEDGTEPEQVEIEEVYGSRWPPTYLVNRPLGKGLIEAEDERLARVPPRQSIGDSFEQHRAEIEAHVRVAEALENAHAEVGDDDEEDLPSTIKEESAFVLEDEDQRSKISRSSSLEAAVIVGEAMDDAQRQREEEIARRQKLIEPDMAVSAVAPPRAPLPVPLPPTPMYMPVSQPAATAAAEIPPPSLPPPPPQQQKQYQQQQYPSVAINQSYEPSLEAIMEAQKITKSAGSALSFEDIPTAVKMLSEALQLLTGTKTPSSTKK